MKDRAQSLGYLEIEFLNSNGTYRWRHSFAVQIQIQKLIIMILEKKEFRDEFLDAHKKLRPSISLAQSPPSHISPTFFTPDYLMPPESFEKTGNNEIDEDEPPAQNLKHPVSHTPSPDSRTNLTSVTAMVSRQRGSSTLPVSTGSGKKFSADPTTVSAGTRRSTSSTLGDLGQLDEAAKMQKEVLEKRRRILGEEHPYTISAMSNLANTLGDLGQLDEAAKMKKEVLEKMKRILGEEHPDTLSVMNNLAVTLGDLSHLNEAITLLGVAALRMKGIHGEEHPRTKVAISNLTRLTANRGTSEAMAEKLEPDLKAKSDAAEVSKLKLISEDAVIVVLGPTGVGKSHFIRAATGNSSIKVGAALESGKSGQ